MATARSRSMTLAGIFLAGALALTACGDSDQASADDVAEEAVETEDRRSDAAATMEPGGAEILSQVPDLEFTEVQQDISTVVSSFDKELRVQRTVQTTTLPIEVAEELAGHSTDFEPGDLVAAADGETFVVAVLQADDPRWEPTDQQLTGSSETETVLRVNGNPLTDPYLNMEAGDQVTVAVSVPEEPQQDAVTLELVQEDVSQEISLVDGSRISSDVEHIYERPTTVEADGESSWSETGESRRGTITMSGQFTDGIVTPLVPQLGWANPGGLFLGLNFNTQELENPHRDLSSIRLELADGTTVQPESRVRGSDGPFSHTAWFQIPGDTTEATALINLKMALGTTEHEVADIEIPLTISGSVVDSAGSQETDEEADTDGGED